jgi:hypothetical protein
VAIAGAESQWNPNAIGDVALETAKWGPSCGFWQVRSLVSPSSFSYPDTLRDKNQLFDPQFNANAAYAFSKQGTNFGAWSTYMGGQYLTHVTDAVAAINRLCGNVTPTPSPVPQMVNNPMNMKVEDISGESINQNLLFTVSPLKPSIILTDTDVIIQTLNDVIVSSVNSGTTIAILAGIKTTSDITVAKCNELASAVNSCCDNAIQSITPIPESGITAPVEQIPSTYIPYVEPDSEVVFNLENFDLNGGTIIT